MGNNSEEAAANSEQAAINDAIGKTAYDVGNVTEALPAPLVVWKDPPGGLRIKFATSAIGNPRLTSHRMQRALEHAAKLLEASDELAGCDLLVQEIYIPPPTPTTQHAEARIADLQVVNGTVADPAKLDAMVKLCELAGFDYVRKNTSTVIGPYIHAGVRRDLLYGPRDPSRGTIAQLRRALEAGWKGIEKFLVPAGPLRPPNAPPPGMGTPDLRLDAGEAMVPSLSWDLSTVPARVGEITLQVAADRGLFPKAYFASDVVEADKTDLTDRKLSRPILRLLPSPVSDLVFGRKPVDLEALEVSLGSYSFVNKAFSGQGRDLQEVAEELTGSNAPESVAPYRGLEIQVHYVLQSMPVTVILEPHASLTAILDLIATELHAQWFWIGGNKLAIVPRPYHLYFT